MPAGISTRGHLDGWANLTVLDAVDGVGVGRHEVEFMGDEDECESLLGS
ncbi:hypothetical protein ACWGMA_12535 [Streptomyces asiaticus]|nr:hypothetical protein OG546_35840 [Streptomyces antimycoticus]